MENKHSPTSMPVTDQERKPAQLEIICLNYYNAQNQLYALVNKEHIVDGKPALWFTHVCSDKSFALGDLISNRPARIDALREEYGDFEVTGEGVNGKWSPKS
jgi:hypothetical protein